MRNQSPWALGLSVGAALLLAIGSRGTLLAQGPPAPPPQQALVDVDGEIETLFEDSNGGARLLHFLHVGAQRLQLQFGADAPPQLPSGSRIRAHGRLQNNTLDLSASGGGSLQTLSLAQPNTFGEQRTLVLLVNFQDNASAPYSTTTAYNTTFQNTSNYYLENTYNQTWLTGDVRGWFTLPMNSGTCDYNTIANLADQAATASGINISAFPRHVYAFPQIAACSWWGLGSVGGNPSRAWVNGSYALKVVSHELGHNFGAYHSHSQPCDVSGCTIVEYGDTHDDMGQVSNGHFNAYQKERLGWLNYGTSPTIQTVSASGSYWIDAYEFAGTAPKALKLLKSVDAYGNKTWYYVEVRAQLGFDASDPPGVLVHTGADADGNSSQHFDLDPASSGFDSLLDVGQTLTDSAAGLSVTAVSVNGSGASLNVTYTGVACASAAPTISLSAATAQIVAPGQTASYTVSVKNNDGSSCGTTNFAMGWTVPAGWTASSNPGALDVAPGSTAAATFALTPASTAAGTYGFTVAAARTTTTGSGGSASGSVLVASALDVTLAISGTNGNRGYQLSATVRTASTPVSGANVTFTIVDPQGLTTTLSGTTNGSGVGSVRFRPRVRGTHLVTVAAAASGLTGGASGSFVY